MYVHWSQFCCCFTTVRHQAKSTILTWINVRLSISLISMFSATPKKETNQQTLLLIIDYHFYFRLYFLRLSTFFYVFFYNFVSQKHTPSHSLNNFNNNLSLLKSATVPLPRISYLLAWENDRDQPHHFHLYTHCLQFANPFIYLWLLEEFATLRLPSVLFLLLLLCTKLGFLHFFKKDFFNY